MKRFGNNLLQFIGDFTVIDLETTGRSNKPVDITEISAIRYRGGKPIDSMSSFVKSENTILPFVQSLTGITDDMLESAPEIHNVIEDLVAFIGNDVILGHNVNFDYGLVYDAYYEKTGNHMKNDYIDTLRISRLMNKDIQNHKLETLCQYFKIERSIGHRALEDSQQTAQVYLKMRQKYIELRNLKESGEGYYERV